MKQKKAMLASTILGMMVWPALLYATAQAVNKQQPYQVNLIVFERSDASTLEPDNIIAPTADIGYKDLQRPQKQDPIAASLHMPKPKYPLQNFDASPLAAAAKKIEASSRYHILLKQSWLQTIPYGGSFQTIALLGGKRFDAWGKRLKKTDKPEGKLTMPGADSSLGEQSVLNNDGVDDYSQQQNVNTETQPAMLSYHQVNGTFRIKRGYFFTIQFTLNALLPESKQTISLDGEQTLTPLKVFQIKQTLKTHSQNIYYLDNPAFGAVLLITRLASAPPV
jgi:hypothetical protein